MKCHQCSKEIKGDEGFESFNENEPTTIYMFCSEKCKNTWKNEQKSMKK